MKRMFENVGTSIQVIAKIIFYLVMITGIITIIVGIYKIVMLAGGWGEYHMSLPKILSLTQEDFATGKDRLVLGYSAKMMVRNGFLRVIASFAVLPLYGFGTLINAAVEIRDLIKGDGDEESEDEAEADTETEDEADTETETEVEADVEAYTEAEIETDDE